MNRNSIYYKGYVLTMLGDGVAFITKEGVKVNEFNSWFRFDWSNKRKTRTNYNRYSHKIKIEGNEFILDDYRLRNCKFGEEFDCQNILKQAVPVIEYCFRKRG